MTPKEKADELIMRMYEAQDESIRWTQDAKRCALVAVDEILTLDLQEVYKNNYYWQEVKREINKL